MEDLDIAHELLRNTLNKLKTSLNTVVIAEETKNELLIRASQDSTIKRFEYSYEAFWKFLKKVLQKKYSLQDVNSPNSVFKACIKLDLCSSEEGRILQTMIDDRTTITHAYDVEGAREIFPHVETYYNTMITILDRLWAIISA
jgi:nucleotidyltransferase substrate binding protein (TIGR01987 family)